MKHDEHYIKEIDHVSILEPIDEIFDHATSLMTPNAVMYGSTITSVIAGLPIEGDLDIAVSNQEYMELCQNFASSVKWLQVNGRHIPERKIPTYNKGPRGFYSGSAALSAGGPSYLSTGMVSSKNPYEDAKQMPIKRMVAFEAVNGACVQIMETRKMSGDMLEDALEIVRKVDFTFCGMAVDMYGRMLETIPHAYDDCKQRVIRIKEYQYRTNPDAMKTRIQKYLKRGWGLTMSIDQAMLNLDKAKREFLKKKESKPKHKKYKKKVSSALYVENQGSQPVIKSKQRLSKAISAPSVADLVRNVAYTKFNIEFRVSINKEGGLDFGTIKNSKRLNNTTAHDIITVVNVNLRNQYNYVDDKTYKPLFNKGRDSNYSYGGSITSISTSNSARWT